MNPDEIINRIRRESYPVTSNIDKNTYLDVIEKVINGYGVQYFEDMASERERFVICIALRACGAISYLLSNNRRQDLYDLWVSLMDKSMEEMFNYPKYQSNPAENDISVKELIIALKNMKHHVSRDKYCQWYDKLKAIDPYEHYRCTLPKNMINNMTAYNMAGEYLRESENMTDTTEYFREHMPLILNMFDENGMFVDHDYPMLYDLTTRCRAAIMLWYGYGGEFFDSLNSNLLKGGKMTLLMQSTAFQLPYGGRSNQYLFNEALVASVCEYEACRYKKSGDEKLAGMFKRCARQSLLSIFRWLNAMDPPKHNKNFFSHENNFGIDGYGTYHRYLIALANFIGYGFTFADDTIKEYASPSELGGYALETSKKLHKVFANCKGNFIEIETAADPKYDATGTGRYHKTGIPVELGLSLPFAKDHRYILPDDLIKRNISICTGWDTPDGKTQYISDFTDELEVTLDIIRESSSQVVIKICYTSPKIAGCEKVTETITLNEKGVKIQSEITGGTSKNIYITVPLFHTNGKDISNISFNKNEIRVKVDNFKYEAGTDGIFEKEKGKYGNRNGIYKLALAKKDGNRISLMLNLF